MSDHGKQYAYNGVMLRCNKGSAPNTLRVLPRPSRIRGQFQAHELDLVPMVNIMSFGGCVVTRGPCMPAPIGWTGVHQGGLRIGPTHSRPLLESSKCQCAVGGSIGITMLPTLSAGGLPGHGHSAPTASALASNQGDATAHEVANHFKLAAVGFAVAGVGLAVAGLFFPPLELAAGASFEAALAASAGTAFAAADASMAVGIGIDAGVAVAHPTPVNRGVIVGDAAGLALGFGIGAASRFGPATAKIFTRQTTNATSIEWELSSKIFTVEGPLPEGIEANPKGVYGYLPKIGSRHYGHDFTTPEVVAKNRTIRLGYLKSSQQTEEAVTKMRAEGANSETIGRYAVRMRDQQKIDGWAHMKYESVEKIQADNIAGAGKHPLGLSADQLFNKYGSWEKVIEKSMEKDDEINILLGINY